MEVTAAIDRKPATGIFSWEFAGRQVEQRDGGFAVFMAEEAFARVRPLLVRRRRNRRRRGLSLKLSQRPNRCAPLLADRADYKAW